MLRYPMRYLSISRNKRSRRKRPNKKLTSMKTEMNLHPRTRREFSLLPLKI